MASWWQTILQSLFPDQQKVRVHEPLSRSATFQETADQWTESGSAASLLDNINRAYYYPDAGLTHRFMLHKLKSPQANGFALQAAGAFNRQEGQLLLDIWKKRLLQAGYLLATADHRMEEKPGGQVQEIDRFYLKPENRKQEPPFAQRWGNISLELISVDNVPGLLRVQASIYADALFKKARSFDSLTELLLSSKGLPLPPKDV